MQSRVFTGAFFRSVTQWYMLLTFFPSTSTMEFVGFYFELLEFRMTLLVLTNDNWINVI